MERKIDVCAGSVIGGVTVVPVKQPAPELASEQIAGVRSGEIERGATPSIETTMTGLQPPVGPMAES